MVRTQDMNRAYAHSLSGFAPQDWEPLECHLEEVGRLAAEFAAVFGAADWGKLAGEWHDLGKYSAEFQAYLRQTSDGDAGEEAVPGRVDHSTFGAQHAMQVLGGHKGQVLAQCIAGHHAGLADALPEDEAVSGSTLLVRLRAGPPRVPRVNLPAGLASPPALKLPIKPLDGHIGFSVAFFVRMIFSCLVDADRCATEAFCSPERSRDRQQPKPPLAELSGVLERFLGHKTSSAAASRVNQVRAQVLQACLTSAAMPPGFFSLNVPTGGGKTYSSLAFALRHALAHGLRRVVMTIPFTSIIEQTADAYREALGHLAARALVEHHSNIEPRKSTRANQLAAENWDAPLIVTTNVQLYESLFASATTPCRKLHRLARSVLILDEAQTLPVELLHPTLLTLKELVKNYGCSVVLCTATQPALQQRPGEFHIGIPAAEIREIMPDVPQLHAVLKRVQVTPLGLVADSELAERLVREPAALCVVNSRPHAAALYEELARRAGRDGTYHLSTYMCAQHRREKLVEIRKRLHAREICRVVSTQLIEAGVDVDFPAVYRAPAGFDAVAQAAGRCNREGRLAIGRVYLFDTEKLPPAGLLRAASQTARELFPQYPDPLTPPAVEAYFRQFYWSQQHAWDKHEVLPALDDPAILHKRPSDLLRLQFRTAAGRYRIIRDEQTPILVPYDEKARALLARLQRGEELDYEMLREAQRYIVGVPENVLRHLLDRHVVLRHDALAESDSGLWLLCNSAAYTMDSGLNLQAAGLGPEVLVV